MKLSLLEKYDKPTPRYTSYPTVPYWDSTPGQAKWFNQVRERISQDPEISLYIHLPYCEQLCTYCGCNKRITKNHEVELPYLHSLLREWELYKAIFPQKPVLKELHLGGGTPTFFRADHLDLLLKNLLTDVEVPEDHSYSFEAHPNNTTTDHLMVLKQHGFNRISIGVQDFSPVIMTAINRRQDEAEVFELTAAARALGYRSINFDMVYGLPFQRMQHIYYSLSKLADLSPDRVAYYSYAHVPWKQAGQRRFTEADIPKGGDKRALYEAASEGMEKLGYQSIGIDHFALPTDALYQSAGKKQLHRNFMGYTPYTTRVLIGLGASAISDAGNMFVQNAVKVETYQAIVEEKTLPVFRGHELNGEDVLLRRHILNLMCRFSTQWDETEFSLSPGLRLAVEKLQGMEQDGLVYLMDGRISVTTKGFLFLRNIAQCFDARYWDRQPREATFSKTL